MPLFRPLYERVMRWSRHPRAPWYLAALSFAESSFFPVPPDVMLAPMSMARPERALRYALLTTLASTAGGLFGYLIGWLALDAVTPLLHEAGYWPAYLKAHAWFEHWGFWAVLVAGFSPIPYKIFTITAGSMGMPLIPFVLASVAGRGSRFFLVAGLLAWGGPRLEPILHRYVERLGWAMVAIGVAVLVWYNR